jgi:small subunit ribosomal protein S1
MTQSDPHPSNPESEVGDSFGDLLRSYEQSHSFVGGQQIDATVISISGESIFVDVGLKREGLLPVTAFGSAESVSAGQKVRVAIHGRDAEGFYLLSLLPVEQPRDWSALQAAFAGGKAIAGTVTGLVKGGLSVDVGVRAFLPASRSGERDAAGMESLVGQTIRCRITKLDEADENVVVDRRVLLEEQAQSDRENRYEELREGQIVSGQIRSLTAYGAFVDLGGVDALLHVSDMAWSRTQRPEDVVSPGLRIDVRVLKIDREKRRISVGLKQLQPDPWDSAGDRYRPGMRIAGSVTRVTDFGAFVQIESGVEGMIHLSEMSWTRKNKRPCDLLQPGESVEAVILSVNAGERRIALGLKQTLGDPWAEAAERLTPGSVFEGPVTGFTKFGAFVEVSPGIEGMVGVNEIDSARRIHHPQEALKLGQRVRVKIVEAHLAKRELRLTMKQVSAVSPAEYFAEHRPGDPVTGRVLAVADGVASVELGEGIQGACPIAAAPPQPGTPVSAPAKAAKEDLQSLTAMLQARWKGNRDSAAAGADALKAGQIRNFRIVNLDPAEKKVLLEPAT